jgi:hypothetical protein
VGCRRSKGEFANNTRGNKNMKIRIIKTLFIGRKGITGNTRG